MILQYLRRLGVLLKSSGIAAFVFALAAVFVWPASASAGWFGEYWNVVAGPSPAIPDGAANMTYTSSEINFNWGTSSPAPGAINVDGFVVRWTQTLALDAGTYYFSATADDGVRVYIDGTMIINGWLDQSPTTYSATRSVTAGSHEVKVEYYENGGGAEVRFSYQNQSPVMQSCSPADGASGVGLGDNLILTFDKDVAAGAGSADDIVIYDSDDQVIEQINSTDAGKVDISGATVTINPTAAFTDMKGYYVKIRSSAFYSTAYGYYYAGISDKTAWNFATGDFTKPATTDDYGAKDDIWQDADQAITLSPTDPLPSSGIVWTRYCVDDGTSACDPAAGTTLSSPYQISMESEGVTYLRYASRDAGSNTQDAVTRVVKIDKTAPAAEAGDDINTGAPFTRTAAASDALSGADPATYRWTKVSGPGNVIFSDATSLTTSIQADSSGAYVIRFSVQDYAGNSSSDSFALMAGSATLPPAAYNPPRPPESGFRVTVNGGAATTAGQNVMLAFIAGDDAARMAISRTLDFEDAFQEEFQTTRSWDLCAGAASCPDGEYVVYVRFYTVWGRYSQPVSAAINLRRQSDATVQENSIVNPTIPTPLPASRFIFARQLRLGMAGEDVRQLQIFLNAHGFTVAASGYGSAGNETAYFGRATRQAVVRFQKAYGLKPYPGNVGPMTLKMLNSL